MPLDRTTMDLAALEAANGFRAAFRFDPNGLHHVSGENEDAFEAASHAYQVWCAVSAQVAADILLLRRGRELNIVSLKGGLIITARSSINIGLLRQALKALPETDFVDPPQPASFKGEKHALWSIIDRLARVEAPRTFEIMLGSFEYVIRAEKSGFSIFDEEGGTDRFIAKTKEVVDAGLALEYTFGETPTGTVSSRHSVTELFGSEAGDTWRFDHSGWPLATPKGVGAEQILGAARLVQSLEITPETSSQVDVLDCDGRFVLRGRSNEQDFVISQFTTA